MLIIFFFEGFSWAGREEGARKPGEMNFTFITASQGSICIQRFSSGECNVVGCIIHAVHTSTHPIKR